MTFILKDRVRETTVTTGTGAIALGGAVANYRAFSSVLANGDTTWYAIVHPGNAWEVGLGTWVTGNTLQRTTIHDSSNSDSLVNFAAGSKDVFIALAAAGGNATKIAFSSGTLMLFQQTNAPIYWTKQVTHNDKALRVVSGAASFGGANSFVGVLDSTVNVSNFTITTSTMPSHSHPVNGGSWLNGSSGGGLDNSLGGAKGYTTPTIGSTGSDGAHSHTFNLNVAYVDLIICSKD